MVTSVSNVSNVGTLSSTGIGSGLDVTTIISKLMAVEEQPLTRLQTQATALNSQLSTVGQLQGYFADLQTKSNALTATTLWSATTATSSDDSAVKVSTSTGASAGSYALSVGKLAVGQTITGSALASSSDTLSAGTLTIELGRYDQGVPPTSFTAKTGSTPVTITIDSGNTSLSALRDQINSANAGVTASIITDASGARLSLRSKDTGAENAFRITATEATDDGDPATGLSALAFDATAASSPMSRSTSAADAELTINGIAITSASNTLNDVVDGLTLNLHKTTTSDVAITVAPDTASVKTAITNFVSAFNTLASFISAQTAYNADTKTGGAMQGDQATLALQNQLRNVINQGSSASSAWSRLSDIGLTIKTDGTLETNATKLDNALGNLPELKKLLATDGASSAESGFIRRFKNLADAALGSEGTFATRTSSIQASVTRNSKSQDAMQKRLEQTQARLQAQYSALDTSMANLNALSAYMTQQITQFNKSTA
jgi:flagellar hook-associated protein 2